MFEAQPIQYEIKIAGFHSIYYFEFSKNFFHEPEQHNFWEMVYVDSGNINAITNGTGCTLTQGQVIFHEPMEVHAHVSDRQVPNSMLVVSFSCNSEIMHYFKGKIFSVDKTLKLLLSLFIEEAKNVLGKIPGDYNDRRPLLFSNDVFGAVQLLDYHFTEFLIKLVRHGNSASSQLVTDRISRELVTNSLYEMVSEYMKQNIYSSLSLKELCNHFLIGKTMLCQSFHDCSGESPMSYYLNLKIAEAKKLLRENSYSITQISDMLGYSSIHTFSRAFKKAEGISPSAYIKKII